ncbi:hypothetical protein WA026_017753 [Henosepilachna vigintioctopunctata]|uniref:Tetraspanin n=1 Tax=Henosepilachna vigintioctopunctata TaxID=420089 RepID=A0AAW1U9I2_9CUCU
MRLRRNNTPDVLNDTSDEIVMLSQKQIHRFLEIKCHFALSITNMEATITSSIVNVNTMETQSKHLAGLAMIILGCVFKFSFMSKISNDAIPPAYGVAPIITIVVGAVVFITAFFGCCGAVRESTCMLTTYAVILLSIFIIQIAIGVFAFLQLKDSTDFHRDLEKGLRKPFENYPKNREVVDGLQEILQCCGINGPEYWNNQIPPSCCTNEDKTCSISSRNLHQHGCVDELYHFLEKSSTILGYVIIGIAATELIGALFGLCLASSIRNHYRRNIYA